MINFFGFWKFRIHLIYLEFSISEILESESLKYSKSLLCYFRDSKSYKLSNLHKISVLRISHFSLNIFKYLKIFCEIFLKNPINAKDLRRRPVGIFWICSERDVKFPGKLVLDELQPPASDQKLDKVWLWLIVILKKNIHILSYWNFDGNFQKGFPGKNLYRRGHNSLDASFLKP